MGSKVAVRAFLAAAAHYGITAVWKRCHTKMSFANSQVDHIYWCVDIYFPTNLPCYTTIDVLEKGNVPILLSLRQMSNLYFTLRMTPEVTYLT